MSSIKNPFKMLRPKEKDLQKAFYNRVKTKQLYNLYPRKFFIYASCNEQMCSRAYTIHLKQMGLVAGIPDHTILIPYEPPAWLEWKRDSKSKLSPAQEEFGAVCAEYGMEYHVSWDVDEAEAWLVWLLKRNCN